MEGTNSHKAIIHERIDLRNRIYRKCLELAADMLDRRDACHRETLESVKIIVDIVNSLEQVELIDPLISISAPSTELDGEQLAKTIRDVLVEEANAHTDMHYD